MPFCHAQPAANDALVFARPFPPLYPVLVSSSSALGAMYLYALHVASLEASTWRKKLESCRNPASIEAGFVGRSRGWPEMSAWSGTGCPASLLGLRPIEAAGMSL